MATAVGPLPVATVTQKAPPAPAPAAPAAPGAPPAVAQPVVFTPATYEGFGTPSQSLLYAQAQLLCKNVPAYINKVEVVRDQLTVFAKRESLSPLMLYLSYHSHTQFKQVRIKHVSRLCGDCVFHVVSRV